ncbi:MAG: hypothetical protein GYB67_00600 [Chloroflexi bacterium]|nr:hypothetical protein [Chloroflexota bacterium]
MANLLADILGALLWGIIPLLLAFYVLMAIPVTILLGSVIVKHIPLFGWAAQALNRSAKPQPERI